MNWAKLATDLAAKAVGIAIEKFMNRSESPTPETLRSPVAISPPPDHSAAYEAPAADRRRIKDQFR
jgi:hypothetical protein